MSWETETTPRSIRFAPLYVALLIVLFGGLNFFKGTPSLSLEDRCNMKNGEWLHDSAVPTCITADGRWLTYDADLGDFVLSGTKTVASIEPPEGSPVVAGASAETCSGTFGDYPVVVPPPYQGGGQGAIVDFSSLSAAAEFRTAINRDVARGVNYAGHYVVASWGCPDFTTCEEYAVIDAIDGKIISFGEKVSGHPRYLIDSRMLQVDTPDGGTATYLIDDTTRKINTCTQ